MNTTQADTLPPGGYFWLWPFQYEVEFQELIEVKDGQLGVVDAIDGHPLPKGRVLASAVEIVHLCTDADTVGEAQCPHEATSLFRGRRRASSRRLRRQSFGANAGADRDRRRLELRDQRQRPAIEPAGTSRLRITERHRNDGRQQQRRVFDSIFRSHVQ